MTPHQALQIDRYTRRRSTVRVLFWGSLAALALFLLLTLGGCSKWVRPAKTVLDVVQQTAQTIRLVATHMCKPIKSYCATVNKSPCDPLEECIKASKDILLSLKPVNKGIGQAADALAKAVE
jgi:hypothetical protein